MATAHLIGRMPRPLLPAFVNGRRRPRWFGHRLGGRSLALGSHRLPVCNGRLSLSLHLLKLAFHLKVHIHQLTLETLGGTTELRVVGADLSSRGRKTLGPHDNKKNGEQYQPLAGPNAIENDREQKTTDERLRKPASGRQPPQTPDAPYFW